MKKPRGNPNWKKGVSGNPGGSRDLSVATRAFRKLSQQRFRAGVSHYSNYSKQELEEELNNKNINVWDCIFAKMIDQAASGDAAARKELFDRMYGKPKEEEDHLDLDKKELLVLNEQAVKVLKDDILLEEATEVKSDELDSLDRPSDTCDSSNTTIDKRDYQPD